MVSGDDDLQGAGEERSSDGDEPHRARRESGARHEVNEPVVFRCGERRIEGWCLNASEGGLRVILEAPVVVDEEYDVAIGDSGGERRVRIVWVRAEKGGAIVGVAFCDTPGSVAPPDTA